MDEWKAIRVAVPIIAIILIVSLWYKYNEKAWIVRCYEEQVNSRAYPETFFAQSEFRDFCADKGVVIKEIGRDYEYLPYEYGVYVSNLDTICPFESTAVTNSCLDEEINKQRQQYDGLSMEIINKAQTEIEKYRAQNEPIDLAVSSILESLPEYTRTKDAYIQRVCSIKNFSTTGTAIGEESRKCTMYYNTKDIQMLENVLSLDLAE